ncbi:hypothetical protein L1987_82619 [Smallanthus sonchifolius]|uniref:Uncharacterized protein n=1 Tax=Smallanthus sonchifolius TaxID=185202 RepID=A0ACB8YAR3_9ASTR|nr:hypothetical protein L1987_82619 [Smallanthus sonchifolius]
MKTGDLELGNIQKHVQHLVYRVNQQDSQTDQFPPSIYMLPHTLRDISPSSFNPQVVSIGPLHREDANVQAFEKTKITYMNKLMRHTKSPREEVLNSCMKKAYTLMDEIKSCYVWTKTYGDAQIAEMMVMDACFILEFINGLERADNPYAGNKSQFSGVLFDLVLLENQIPFFFLKQIYECTILKNHPNVSLVSFMKKILKFLNIFTGDIVIDYISSNTNIHHILSLLHECYKPPDDIKPTSPRPKIIYSAADLHRAGVNFKPKQIIPKWEMMMEVKLNRFPCFPGSWGKATLTMPVLKVGDSTEKILRNLIAYEQSSPTCNHITSYAYAMDMLVNTSEDVAKLVDSGVVINEMGSNEEVANMINDICKLVLREDFFYNEQWETLYNYSNSYWPKNIAWLRSTYFSSPWSIIALFAGIILFVLTLVQTIFTVNPVGSN